jgi:hypothetical protein
VLDASSDAAESTESLWWWWWWWPWCDAELEYEEAVEVL